MEEHIFYKIKRIFENKRKNKYSITNIMLEGGAGGHMRHPYEDDSLTLSQIKEIILDASSGMLDDKGESRAVEKIDGYNMHFGFFVNATNSNIDYNQDVYFDDIEVETNSKESSEPFFLRSSSKAGDRSMNLQAIKSTYSSHPAKEVFILGCEVIARACANIPINILKDVFTTPSHDHSDQVPENSEFVGTYVNTEIVFPDKPIQIKYDSPVISFHELKDYYKVPKGKKFQVIEFNYNDERYNRFINSFNSQNLNNIVSVSTSILRGEDHDPERDKEHEFSLIGSTKNKIVLNKLGEPEVQELLGIVDNIKRKSGLTENATIRDLKVSYVQAVCQEQAAVLKDILINDFGSQGLEEEQAKKLSGYIVYNIAMKVGHMPVSNQDFSEETAASVKKIFSDKDLKKALSQSGAFRKKDNQYLSQVYPVIKDTFTNAFKEVTELFFILGVEMLQGRKSNLMTRETAKIQSEKMTKELTLALQDYYDLKDDDPMKQKLLKHVSKIESLIVRQNRKLGITVNRSNKDEIIENVKNISIEAIEGIVYNFKNKRFKFTGTYAPVNQLMGFNTVGLFPSRFPRVYNERINWNLKEDSETVLILPGSFKPPHIGHMQLLKHYMDKGVDQALILVTDPRLEKSVRKIGDKTIDGNVATVLWKILAKDLIESGKVNVIVSPASNPIEVAVSMLVKGSNKIKPGTKVYLGASSKLTYDKIKGTKEKIIGTEQVQSDDSDRYDNLLEYANLADYLDIQDPRQNACPPVTLPAEYIQKCQDMGVYESLPSQIDGKDSSEYHASDLRYLLAASQEREELKELLVYFLGSEQIINQYISYIF